MKRPLFVALSVALLVIVGSGITRLLQHRQHGAAPSGEPGPGGDRSAAATQPLRKVLFIGVDAGDWEIIHPLLDKGRLPHLAAIVRDGATGTLHSLEPMLSPLLWTTMATGKLPEEHGVLSFTAYDPETGKRVPISRAQRRVDAYWNMLSDAGRSVDVVGWLATYPAESIRGVMVTDRVGYLAYAGASESSPIQPGTVSPENRAAEIAGQVVRAGAVTYDEFKRFMPVDEASFLKARSQAFDPKDPVNNMIMLYASTQSYHNIARHLLTQDRPGFLAVYFELVDAAGHLFMHYAPPRRPDADATRYELFKNAVEESYVLQDEIIGDLVSRADDRTVILIASDHGFRSGAARPHGSPEIWAGKAADWHRLEGIIGLYGPGIRKGHAIAAASVIDIAPTILALQGLPKPTDMPGKALVEAFDDSLTARLDTRQVATLQRHREPAPAPSGDPNADEAMKKIVALGYITRENPDEHNNLGQRYKQQGEFAKAAAEFQKAIAARPNFPAAHNNLGSCYLELGQEAKAEESFRKALALKKDDVYALNNLAVLYAKRGDLPRAAKLAEQAVALEPNYANGHLTLGSIYGSMSSLDRAEREFRKVLQIDPSNKHAKEYLSQLRAAQGTSP